MSGPSYRLQTPRPRRPPAPIALEDSPFQSSSLFNSSGSADSDTLIYDLPSSMSPQASPEKKERFSSPTLTIFRPSSRARNGRPTPPPSGRNRSATPLGVQASELEAFADLCRSWYYEQNDNAGRLMSQTLVTLPPSQKAPYSRLQASIRSAYHRHVNARKHAEFQAHLSATQPGGSLMAHSRSNPRGKEAQKERYDRTERFIRTWCNAGMPGTTPFFEALWAVMRLQVIPENIGGVGRNRIEWEFDDAVFKESAGKDFMHEAIDVLKGVLAFEDMASSDMHGTNVHMTPTSQPELHSHSQFQTLAADKKSFVVPIANRARAASDPFSDRSEAFYPVIPTIPESIATKTVISAKPPSVGDALVSEDTATVRADSFGDADGEHLRIWTSPDLSNPEILDLLKLFPSFVSRRPLPRFPVSSLRHVDVEEGEEDGLDGKQIHFGTGSLRVSTKQRSDGWIGDWWTRFILWWRRLFC